MRYVNTRFIKWGGLAVALVAVGATAAMIPTATVDTQEEDHSTSSDIGYCSGPTRIAGFSHVVRDDGVIALAVDTDASELRNRVGLPADTPLHIEVGFAGNSLIAFDVPNAVFELSDGEAWAHEFSTTVKRDGVLVIEVELSLVWPDGRHVLENRPIRLGQDSGLISELSKQDYYAKLDAVRISSDPNANLEPGDVPGEGIAPPPGIPVPLRCGVGARCLTVATDVKLGSGESR